MESSFCIVSDLANVCLPESFTVPTFHLVWPRGVRLVEWNHVLHSCGGKYVTKKHNPELKSTFLLCTSVGFTRMSLSCITLLSEASAYAAKLYNKQLSRGYSDEKGTLQFRACAVKWEWENKHINSYQEVVMLTSESFESLQRKSLFVGPLKVPSRTTSTHLQSATGELDELCKLSVGWPKSSPYLHLPCKRISGMWIPLGIGMPCPSDFLKVYQIALAACKPPRVLLAHSVKHEWLTVCRMAGRFFWYKLGCMFRGARLCIWFQLQVVWRLFLGPLMCQGQDRNTIVCFIKSPIL